ncbi:MAG: TraB/GumN family protein [Bacteroidales bacterium]|nr:TraB/GumN family protein [Bacteroidales bacterium]
MKRILAIIALLLLGVQAANAQLLWKISGRGIGKPSYILGTHHAVPYTFCDTIPGLMKAFGEVGHVVGEFDMLKMDAMTPQQMQNMQKMMMMPADTTMASLFSDAQRDTLDAYLKNTLGANLQMLSAMKPMTIMVTVQQKMLMELIPDIASLTGIDKYMQTLAAEKGKQVGGLETMEYQLGLLYGSSLQDQADALLDMVRRSNSKELLQELTAAYKTQNLDTLWKIFQDQMTQLEYDALVKTRNLNWLEEMKVLLPTQSTLYVVGAGHLPGDAGMINLLRDAGYKVKQVKR